MTDIPTLLEEFANNLRKQLKPIDDILKPKRQVQMIEQGKEEKVVPIESVKKEEENEELIISIPQANIAIFWDYENFPIPNYMVDELFFEALFPSGSEERYVVKRVYGKKEIIKQKLELIEKYGFEYKEGLLSGKTNEIDHVMMTDCVEYCTEAKGSLDVIIMAGDADYMALIEKLAEQGHEVRLVCNDRRKVKESLQKIIPVIIDRLWIKEAIDRLNSQLFKLTSMTNYILAMQENKTTDFDELYEEIEEYYKRDLRRGLKGLFMLMLEHPAYNWQYTVSNEFIQKIEYIEDIKINDQNQTGIVTRKKEIEYQLAYEEDYEEWVKLWDERKKYDQEREKQREWLVGLYTRVNLPYIRNYAQRELIKILLQEQSEEKNGKEKLFRNTKDIQAYIDKLAARDKVIEGNFKCVYCNKKFNKEESVKQHTTAVHKKKRPENLCPICGKKLQNKNNVENHRRQVHGINDQPLPEECNNCYIRFETKQALRDHKRMKHKE